MNKIGEFKLNTEIKILDAFNFPEQFDAVNISNLQEGLWLAFNEVFEHEMGDIVTKFYIVEKNYFQNNPNEELYLWEKQTHENAISIEKGVVGIFDKDFTDSEGYVDELVEATSNSNQAGVSKNYVVCNTPYGNDDCFLFDIVKKDNKIVAIKINFDIHQDSE